jgi:hypothetical protein
LASAICAAEARVATFPVMGLRGSNVTQSDVSVIGSGMASILRRTLLAGRVENAGDAARVRILDDRSTRRLRSSDVQIHPDGLRLGKVIKSRRAMLAAET